MATLRDLSRSGPAWDNSPCLDVGLCREKEGEREIRYVGGKSCCGGVGFRFHGLESCLASSANCSYLLDIRASTMPISISAFIFARLSSLAFSVSAVFSSLATKLCEWTWLTSCRLERSSYGSHGSNVVTVLKLL